MAVYTNNAIEFVKSRGFKTIKSFAIACDEDASNMRRILIGTRKPEIKKLIVMAGVLKVNLILVIQLFYPDEIKEYEKLIETR